MVSEENNSTRSVVGQPAGDMRTCPVRKAMNLIGSKWKMLLLQNLGSGMKRYGELKRLLPDISEKMLIQELKELVASGLVAKRVYPEIPPRVEYSLTANGQHALPVLDSVVAFGNAYMQDQPQH
ncbi:helix-turn-helix domain-containing protein [Hymenobacter sp. YC55]|uniref:winged helix-turn-helix transcriptional regulator n=1 Tax=Hymenobacter sp. YC55 TaxID=3034019 RepID=UPI0023F934B2|nr:helix-turn-helix domain-containing protein [Hymenobacter sp. YC55]MDF7815022.1 helix-turn-helix domain-containing protein [Hymenobacter sp. YC55]